MAMKPRIAPTTMKTVPSGKLLVCMKGALAVGGTDGATIWYAPDSVGRPVKAPSAVAVVPVITGADVATPPVVPEPVITTPLDEDLSVGVAVAELPDPVFDAAEAVEAEFPVAAVAEEILGRSADEDWAEAIARRESAKTDVRSGVLRASLMVDIGIRSKEMLECRRGSAKGCRSQVRIESFKRVNGCC